MAKKKTIRTIAQERTPMREQDARERACNFREVALGYSVEEALREADRCLQCPDEPCVRGCPVNIHIPQFIEKIAEKNYRGAYDVITDTNLLPPVCGRVCPQETQCEGVCTVGDTLEPVAIGRLERFVGGPSLPAYVAEERRRSPDYGGRSVFGWETSAGAGRVTRARRQE